MALALLVCACGGGGAPPGTHGCDAPARILSGAPTEPCARRVDSLLAEASAYYTGTAGTVDDEAALGILRDAVDGGHPVARMWWARVLSRGRMGVPRDTTRARAVATEVLEDVRALADAGWTEAVFLMGTAHDEGLGVPENPAAAVPWWERAAREGHVLAAHNLGNAAVDGRGVPQSDSLAVVWWRQAAEAGDAIPQHRLARMYEEGRGVPTDLEAARRWYRAAASRGHDDAASALQRLEGE